jgi:hypothetical protein
MNILDYLIKANTWVSEFFAEISKITIWGFPLDTSLHIIVGFLITYIGLKLKFKFLQVFIFLLIVESIKALYAAMTIDYSILHGMKEFFATFIYPALLVCVRKIKEKKKSNSSF